MKISHVVTALIGVIAISGCQNPKPRRHSSQEKPSSSDILSSSLTSQVSTSIVSSSGESSIIPTSGTSITSATSTTSETSATSTTSKPTTTNTSKPTTSSSSSSSSSASSSSTTSGPGPYEEYYASITPDLKGDTLKTALYNIIRGHTKIGYGSLADAFATTDRNWEKSPNESDTNPYMNLIYLVDNQNSPRKHSEYTKIWDKEHIWAKANGFSKEGCMAYSDMHHIRASDKNNNNSRSSNALGYVTSGGKYIEDCNGDDSGYLAGSVYCPTPEFRGDAARALFYMATRYGFSECVSKGEVQSVLQLTKGTDKSGGKWGYLTDLLRWNEEDPVSEFERNRNNLIYERFQHNRNPYIDHPEWARKVFDN